MFDAFVNSARIFENIYSGVLNKEGVFSVSFCSEIELRGFLSLMFSGGNASSFPSLLLVS